MIDAYESFQNLDEIRNAKETFRKNNRKWYGIGF